MSFAGLVPSDVSLQNASVSDVFVTGTLNGNSSSGSTGTASTVLVDSPTSAYAISSVQDGSVFDVRVLQDRDLTLTLPAEVVDGVQFTLEISASQSRSLVISVMPPANILDIFVMRFPFNPEGPSPLPVTIHQYEQSSRSFVDLSPTSVYIYIGQLKITGDRGHWRVTGTIMA